MLTRACIAFADIRRCTVLLALSSGRLIERRLVRTGGHCPHAQNLAQGQHRPLSQTAVPACVHLRSWCKMAEYQPKAVKDVPAEAFIKAYAAHLKSTDKLQIPDWVDVVKTARFKELPPQDKDWYYIRAAAIARQIYVRQGLGVGQLRMKFGGSNKRRGVKPEHFSKGSGGHIRHIIQQFEQIGFIEKHTGAKGGRRITPSGQKDMDLIAGRVECSLPDFGF